MVSWSQVARRIRVPLGFAFAAVYLWLAHPAWYSLLAGGVIASAGLTLRAAASGHVRKNSELTTTGPYAYTRNPLYLGSIIIAAGFAVAARSAWIAAILALMFLLVYVPVVRSEERFLRAQFPGYEAYARQVPRFGLRLGAVQAANGRFAGELYLRHREYNALIGAAAMMVALVVKLVWLGSR
jgi:protein-S-isoprenylcysteine O-methyltransferase Ste14